MTRIVCQRKEASAARRIERRKATRVVARVAMFLAEIELNDASVRFNARLIRWRIQFNLGRFYALKTGSLRTNLFDHLIRPRQHIRRNCQADLLRRF
jgi:hypothetical protein